MKTRCIYSSNNLPKIKDGAYVINRYVINELKSIGTHWISLCLNCNNVTYFDSFGVENIPKEIKKIIVTKNFITNTYRIEAYDSIMWDTFVLDLLILC